MRAPQFVHTWIALAVEDVLDVVDPFDWHDLAGLRDRVGVLEEAVDLGDLVERLEVLEDTDLDERVGHLEGLGLESSIGYLDARVAGLDRVDLDELSGQVSGLETCVEAYALEGASDRERIEALEARVEALARALEARGGAS
jgi:hypothetical protein